MIPERQKKHAAHVSDTLVVLVGFSSIIHVIDNTSSLPARELEKFDSWKIIGQVPDMSVVTYYC
jgi:hypothetical protein